MDRRTIPMRCRKPRGIVAEFLHLDETLQLSELESSPVKSPSSGDVEKNFEKSKQWAQIRVRIQEVFATIDLDGDLQVARGEAEPWKPLHNYLGEGKDFQMEEPSRVDES